MKIVLRICLILCMLASIPCVAQETNYFIVIGAFQQEANAQAMLQRAEASNLPARYALHPDNKRFYVYVRLVTSLSLARETVRSVRQEGFASAWIFDGDLVNPVTLARVEAVGQVTPVFASVENKVEKENEIGEPNEKKEEQPTQVVKKEDEVIEPPQFETEPETKEAPKPAGAPFVFKISTPDGKPLTGVIRLQESDRATQFQPYEANEKVYVTAPTNRSGRWYVVCDVVGYRTARVMFNYKEIDKVMELTESGEHLMELEMVPVKKGDYIELERVKFFTNANIFRPESKRELDELVAMMNNNANYKIRIHGHTNGNQGRDIVEALPEQSLFETSPDNKKYGGSAKQLSTLRAASVKRYLIENGIDASRIDIKGEGGKQKLYEGTLAELNARVEIEITKH